MDYELGIVDDVCFSDFDHCSVPVSEAGVFSHAGKYTLKYFQ